MAWAGKISLQAQIAAVARELDKRRSVYPRWVQQKKMRQAEADYQMACMEEVQKTLESLAYGKDGNSDR